MPRMIAAIFALFLLPATALAETPPDEAAAFIEGLGDRAVEVLQDQSISLEEREAKLRDIVAGSFEVQEIGRFVLDKAWERASAEERSEYLDLFSNYVLQTYTKRLGGYSGQTLTIEEAKVYRERLALVSTRIVQEGTDDIKIDWLVRKRDNAIRILDVVIDGKSMTLTQKREFASIIAREDIGGLLQLLRLKISKYSAQG
ncbi:MAG: ABC transporter substrate-binding protein [Alphaproteobacteria bacterium]|nr:ABC transporter substrate-binding protein [Alphaproteobacteria bacterium]